MKKILSIITILSLLVLVGCKSQSCDQYCQDKGFQTGRCLTCSGLINAQNPAECDSENFFHDTLERKICLGKNWQVEDTAGHGCYCE